MSAWNPRKRFNKWASEWRNEWWQDLTDPGNRRRAAFDAFVFDHGFIRSLYLNVAKVDDQVYRSSQPSARDIERFARQGLRTIINFRGESTWGSYALEREACRDTGLTLIDHRLHSRAPPTAERILALKDIFETAERPLLMHCKSGADRAGIGSALYVLMMGSGSPQDAARQLSLRFGHIRASNTGVLDRFVEEYAAINARTPTPFLEWVKHHYDRDAMQAEFRDGKLFSFLTDRLLRRE